MNYIVISKSIDAVVAIREAIDREVPTVIYAGRTVTRHTAGFGGDLTFAVANGNLRADAIITPGNSYGDMSGTFDLAVRNILGTSMEAKVQHLIQHAHYGELLVGNALLLPCPTLTPFKFLVYAPTMRIPKRIPAGSDDVYRSILASLQVIGNYNERNDMEHQIRSVVLTAHGHATGGVLIADIARQTAMAIAQFENRYTLGYVDIVERDLRIHGN